MFCFLIIKRKLWSPRFNFFFSQKAYDFPLGEKYVHFKTLWADKMCLLPQKYRDHSPNEQNFWKLKRKDLWSLTFSVKNGLLKWDINQHKLKKNFVLLFYSSDKFILLQPSTSNSYLFIKPDSGDASKLGQFCYGLNFEGTFYNNFSIHTGKQW